MQSPTKGHLTSALIFFFYFIRFLIKFISILDKLSEARKEVTNACATSPDSFEKKKAGLSAQTSNGGKRERKKKLLDPEFEGNSLESNSSESGKWTHSIVAFDINYQ